MKRQERLALFLQREITCLQACFARLNPEVALIYPASSELATALNPHSRHVFQASATPNPTVSAVFSDEAWALPKDFFDLIVLPHPFEQGLNFHALIDEAKYSLRKNGTLLISGFNRTRLCSLPIQKTFCTQAAPSQCKTSYSALSMRSTLETAGFNSNIERFDFWRFAKGNDFLLRIAPFLGIGFVIEAKQAVTPLMPLPENAFSDLKERVLSAARLPPLCPESDVGHRG